MMNHDELMSVAVDDYFLEHYGVKGMKWGVRKQPQYASGRRLSGRVKARVKRVSRKTIASVRSTTEATKAKIKARVQANKEKKAEISSKKETRKQGKESSKDLRVKQLKSLSSEEIEDRLKRIELENKYLAATQTRSDKAKSKIKQSVGNAVTELAKEQSKKYLGYFIDYKLTGGKEAHGEFSKFAKSREDAKSNGNQNKPKPNPNEALQNRVNRLKLEKQELSLDRELKNMQKKEKETKKAEKAAKYQPAHLSNEPKTVNGYAPKHYKENASIIDEAFDRIKDVAFDELDWR